LVPVRLRELLSETSSEAECALAADSELDSLAEIERLSFTLRLSWFATLIESESELRFTFESLVDAEALADRRFAAESTPESAAD
jgi:hypothetical protein